MKTYAIIVLSVALIISQYNCWEWKNIAKEAVPLLQQCVNSLKEYKSVAIECTDTLRLCSDMVK